MSGDASQHVPSDLAGKPKEYLTWLIDLAGRVKGPFIDKVDDLIKQFAGVTLPQQLKLEGDFPFRLWRKAHGSALRSGGGFRLGTSFGTSTSTRAGMAESKSDAGDSSPDSSPGKKGGAEVKQRPVTIGAIMKTQNGKLCLPFEAVHGSTDNRVSVRVSGDEDNKQMRANQLGASTGGAVLICAPIKERERAEQKVAADYKDTATAPGASRLLDLVRCTVIMDDPYALAAFVVFVKQSFKVLRLKNRFAEDAIEPVTLDELQTEFYNAEHGAGTQGKESGQEYRDVMMNVEMAASDGTPFVCEIQATLSSFACLKNSLHTVYELMRMKGPSELKQTYVFSKPGGKAA
jgi:hypothetical protein